MEQNITVTSRATREYLYTLQSCILDRRIRTQSIQVWHPPKNFFIYLEFIDNGRTASSCLYCELYSAWCWAVNTSHQYMYMFLALNSSWHTPWKLIPTKSPRLLCEYIHSLSVHDRFQFPAHKVNLECCHICRIEFTQLPQKQMWTSEHRHLFRTDRFGMRQRRSHQVLPRREIWHEFNWERTQTCSIEYCCRYVHLAMNAGWGTSLQTQTDKQIEVQCPSSSLH